MTRNLFFACALMAAAASATFWALAPGCEGSFCLNRSLPSDVGRDGAEANQVPGAGRELLGVTAQESAPAAGEARLSRDETPDFAGQAAFPDEARVAAEPPEEWQDDGTASAGQATDDIFEEADTEDYGEPRLTLAQRRANRAAAEKAAKQWETLVEAALNEPDDELRGAAINSVSVHRSAESVVVLNDVAAADPSSDNRLKAVQQLWYSAADGFDSDGSIQSTLTAALDDPNKDVAEMAEKALADLQALEESRALD